MVELKDANMKQTSRWNCEETEIDLYQCVKVLINRKITFVVVFLLFFAVGLGWSLSFPKIYRISTLLQSSVSGKEMAKAEDIESAESLKVLIINDAFNEALVKRLNMDPDKNLLRFDVVVPDKTNILKVSIDLEGSRKKFGVVVLRNLADLISESYIKQTEARLADISNGVKVKEQSIKSAKDKAGSLQKRIKETTDKEGKLRKEIKTLYIRMAQILDNLEAVLKEKVTIDDAYTILPRNNFIQNKLYHSHWLNDQLGELSIRKDKLNLEIRNIDSQISNLQINIEKLNSIRNFVPSLKILSQPKVSSFPLRIIHGKILALMINMGMLFGVLAVFLKEFWSTKRKKL